MEVVENRIFLSCARAGDAARIRKNSVVMPTTVFFMLKVSSLDFRCEYDSWRASAEPNKPPSCVNAADWSMGVLEYWLINAPLHYSTTPVFQFQPTLDKLKGFNLEQKPNLAVGKEPHMFAKIRHVAAHTERYDSMAKFYQTIFGMKQITTGLVDETGQHNPNRGHISDGVIGLALLTKRPGSQQGLDHFGFECEDVKEVLERIKQKYPGLLFTKALSYVPFAGIRAQDPAGTQFDLSQKGMSNVR